MATLNAGQSTTITLLAGYTLELVGNGSIINFASLDKTPRYFSGNGNIGPFDYDVALSVSASTLVRYEKINYADGAVRFLESDGKIVGYKNQDGSSSTNKKSMKIALGICGQSNEGGRSQVADSLGVLQKGSLSAPSQGYFEPDPLNLAGYGSMFTHAAELLGQDGIKVDLFNGAVGASSFISDWCGIQQMGGRANSTAYRGKRTSEGDGDPGHRGDYIYVNAAIWEATTGNRHLVFTNVPITIAGVTYYSDPGSVVKETTLVTAGSPPVFPGSPAVGNTVVDGAITWTCIIVGAKTADSGTTRVVKYDDDGFDPYYMCQRVRDKLMKSPVVPYKRFVYFQNGQTDAGQPTILYTQALRWLALYFMRSPYKMQAIFGLSMYYVGASTAAYDLIETTLSGGGIASTPNYATSPLTTTLLISAYHLATPGQPMTDFGFYYGESLYRHFGTDVERLGLSSGQPHTDIDGAIACAEALYPTLRKIVTNSAV